MNDSIGIDIGSTHCKAVRLHEGKLRGVRSINTDLSTMTPIGPAYNAEKIFQDICAMIRSLQDEFHAPAEGIGISAMVDSYLFFSFEKGALTPVIPWFNDAGAKYETQFIKRYNADELWHKTGQTPSVKRAWPRLQLLHSLYPEAIKEADLFISLYAYILYRFSGRMVTDYSVASRSMLFDLYEKEFISDLLIDTYPAQKLPPLVASGDCIGTVIPSLRTTLNLNEDCRVYVAGHDHISAFHVIQTAAPGAAANSMGTAEVLTGNFSEMKRTKEMREKGISFGLISKNKSYWLANQPSSGICYEYLLKRLAFPAGDYHRLQVPEGLYACDKGLFFVPYLNGSGTPLPNSTRRFGFIDLNHLLPPRLEDAPPGLLAAAVGEALAFESRRIQKSLGDLLPNKSKIIATGGGTRNEHLCTCKAALSDTSFFKSSLAELSAAGAALYASPGSCIDLREKKITSDPERREMLLRYYPVYLELIHNHQMKLIN